MKGMYRSSWPIAAAMVLTMAGCSDGNNSTPETPIDPPLPEPPVVEEGDGEPPLTYFGRTRSIIDKKCTVCHVENGIAPFKLETYEDIDAIASVAAHSIETGAMPPWPPTKGYTGYRADRSLSDEERYDLLHWLRNGRERGDESEAGDSDDSDSGSQETVEFDLQIPLPQAYTPIEQPDDHRCFALEWPKNEFGYITAVDVIPDAVQEVHHVIVAVADPENAPIYYAADGEDGRPGWKCLGSPNVDGAPLPRLIGGWVPGTGRDALPSRAGVGIEPGSVIVVQMHYNTLVTEPVPDQSTILFSTSETVERPASTFLLTDPNWLQPGGMPIPAGEANVHHEFVLPAIALPVLFGEPAGITAFDNWVMHAGFLHMHNLGKSGRITLIREDGSEQILLDIRDWDFDWQGTYIFDKEVMIRPTDQLKMECRWDNSQANQIFVDGEQLPTKDVEWGDGTQDEMCLTSVFMTGTLDDYDYQHQPSVHVEQPGFRQAFRAGDLVPIKLLFNNFSLHEPGAHDAGDSNHQMDHGDDHSSVYSGHYHVYLNSEDDEADHLTAWDDVYFYQLPEDIEPGIHELRFSLRGDDHHALGINQRVPIEVIDAEPVAKRALIDANMWEYQDAEDDLFADQRPEVVNCPDNSWYVEFDTALEVQTGFCNYLAVAQPSLEDISAGDTLSLVLWHGQLRFEEPAEAHVAITVGDRIVWETTVLIPSDADIFDVDIPVDFDAPAGTKIGWHLQNHGYNTWTLLSLTID